MQEESGVSIALTFDFDAYSNWITSFKATSPSMLSRGEFAPVGVRRVLALLDKFNAKGTFFIPGHTALAWPEDVLRIRDAGHEIGHHNWIHENPATLNLEEERTVIEKGLEALQRVAGLRPTGFRSPAWDNSPNTVGLLLDYGFEYESSMMASDFSPYWCRTGDEWPADDEFRFGKPVDLVEIPVSWYMDDWPYFEHIVTPTGIQEGLRVPDEALAIWKTEFDYLYHHEKSGLLCITMHPEVIGKGYRMLMLESFLRYAAGHPRVTFTTCADYARTWRVGRTPSLPIGAGPARAKVWESSEQRL